MCFGNVEFQTLQFFFFLMRARGQKLYCHKPCNCDVFIQMRQQKPADIRFCKTRHNQSSVSCSTLITWRKLPPFKMRSKMYYIIAGLTQVGFSLCLGRFLRLYNGKALYIKIGMQYFFVLIKTVYIDVYTALINKKMFSILLKIMLN